MVLEARNTSDCFEASSSPLLFLFSLPLNLPHRPPSTLHTLPRASLKSILGDETEAICITRSYSTYEKSFQRFNLL